jgi:hypothetical protein
MDINNDIYYNKLNKKLDTLRLYQTKTTKTYKTQHTQYTHTFYERVRNLSNTSFNKEEMEILELGLNYAYTKPTHHFLHDLVIDTENAIKRLNKNEQDGYRLIAYKKLKQIQNSNTTNALHKRQLYIAKKIRTKLKQNNLIITKADKGKTVIIIDQNLYTQKVENFLNDNKFIQLTQDPTDKYQRQINQTIQKCNILINKQQRKYLNQIKPQPPTLNAQIKLHKKGEPIRPVVNNIQAPTYKIAKYLNKWLSNTL